MWCECNLSTRAMRHKASGLRETVLSFASMRTSGHAQLPFGAKLSAVHGIHHQMVLRQTRTTQNYSVQSKQFQLWFAMQQTAQMSSAQMQETLSSGRSMRNRNGGVQTKLHEKITSDVSAQLQCTVSPECTMSGHRMPRNGRSVVSVRFAQTNAHVSGFFVGLS